MALSALVALVVAQSPAEAPDPYLLPIGPKRQVTVHLDTITATRNEATVTVDDIAKAARGKRFVYLGEQHATAAHQQLQADIIEALVRQGRTVVVGLEMITRPKQSILDTWNTAGDEATFLKDIDWKGQWGFDFKFYRPIFEATRRNNIPMVALNVPRDWVRSVGRGGFAALTAEQKAELPEELSLKNTKHRAVFDALMGGHPPTGPQGENIYSAQVLWDEGMADTALKYLEAHRGDKKDVFVVIAGVGHVMYGQGINYRVAKRRGGRGITVAMMTSQSDRQVSKGIADFVYVSREVAPSPK
ncbi:MAG: ChaN family lipoprotein [Fimbriimonas sp.]